MINNQEFANKSKGLLLPTLLTLLIVFIISIIVSLFVARKITNPILVLRKAINNVEKGDFTVRVNMDQNNELGDLSENKSEISKNREMMQKIAGVSLQVSDASQTLVASAEENTASANEVASTMEQISAGTMNQSELMEENMKAASILSDKIQLIEHQSEQMKHEAGQMTEVSVQGFKR